MTKLNEHAQGVNLQRYSHPFQHRHDFTPDFATLNPVKLTEMFPGRSVNYQVRNAVQLMPLAGDCKQDMYMYTESIFMAYHAIWAKWPLFRYGKMSTMSNVQVPETVPYFTLRQVLEISEEMNVNHDDIPPIFLSPGSLLDTMYGICSLRNDGKATVGEYYNDLSPDVLDAPLNGLYLRAYFHHYLINHTNQWLSPLRYRMFNDEYPYRNDDVMSYNELKEILTTDVLGAPWLPHRRKATVLHERDYFTAANPEPQKGAAVTTVAGQTIQDLTKAIHQQEILEKDADAGNSHYEAIVARYGVTPKSLGIMRPIPAAQPTRQIISINPIFNQAGDTTAPISSGSQGVNFQGDISGRGFSSDGQHHVNFTADVDGVLMTCVFIRQQTIYHQGIDRKFFRLTRNEFFEPAMISDGDEPIYQQELLHPMMDTKPLGVGLEDDPNAVFGYRNKYLDFHYCPSRISGDLRTTMKHWSLHRDFTGDVRLNDEFVRADDSPSRLFSYEGQPARTGYPRFIVYMEFVGNVNDFIPNYTKRDI